MYHTLKKKKISKITQTQTQQTQVVCEEDRISNLPDEILVHILSFLRMKDAVRTSILANRWRYLWTWNPSLDFSCCKPKVIDQCLDLHKAPKLHSFKVSYCNTSTAEADALNRWLRYSATHRVEELLFSHSYGYCGDYPASLFECQSLMQLTLRYGKLSLPVDFCGFKSLVTLCLEQVFIKGEELCTLISTCDQLENLRLIRCGFAEKQLKISATNSSLLRHLKITSYEYPRSFGRLEINAPSLSSFTCSGWKLSLSDFPHLYKADLRFINWNEDLNCWRRILSAITCVRTLSAGDWLFQPKCRKHLPVLSHHFEFKYLKELNVHINDQASKDYLASFISLLRACPALETVCLHLRSGLERDRCIRYDRVMSWLRQIRDPVFSHDRLKKLKVVGFRSTKIELLVLKFLLERTIALESLILILPQRIFKSKSELLKNELNLHKMNSTSIEILHMRRY
ncbi:F-box protein [Cinnamomum micranthum f. kanehirae]|uniref:F-box protein n=1 Tax=Cinnamomum micranthum f. kanehirae TaxID=337451 RepID=A0A3S3NIE4_9MAGN|nr:F-box protein [Cinnamomum micranthum f. kanehirae]